MSRSCGENQGPILYQTTDEFYQFSPTELNCLNRIKAFRPNVSLDESSIRDTGIADARDE